MDSLSLTLAKRQVYEQIRYFVPNGGQQRFIDEISRPEAFIVVNGSGNGAGKSYGIVAIAAALCYPDLAPACFGGDLFRKWPHPKRIRIASTPKEIESIGSIQTAIEELFPKGRYEALKKGKSFFSQYKTDTGWIIDLFSYEQDKSEMAGPTLGLLIFNEPPPEPLWKEGLSRMRKGGLVLVAMTSLLDQPWVVDGILGKANGKDFRVLYCDVEENCKEHGKNGTLNHAQVEKILAQYDPDEREARKTGKPLSLSGRIFKSFDRTIHVPGQEIRPADGAVYYMACDPAIGKPIACIWAFVDGSQTVHVYDEYPDFPFEGAKDSNLTVKDYAAIFKQIEKGKTIEKRIIDRHFANVRRTMGGMTLKQEFGEAGVEFFDSYNMDPASEVETGILKVKEYLNYDKAKPVDGLNRPKLLISPKCTNLIAAMERWGRSPETGKPKDQYKDFTDILRYLLMDNPSYDIKKPWAAARLPHYGVGT